MNSRNILDFFHIWCLKQSVDIILPVFATCGFYMACNFWYSSWPVMTGHGHGSWEIWPVTKIWPWSWPLATLLIHWPSRQVQVSAGRQPAHRGRLPHERRRHRRQQAPARRPQTRGGRRLDSAPPRHRGLRREGTRLEKKWRRKNRILSKIPHGKSFATPSTMYMRFLRATPSFSL